MDDNTHSSRLDDACDVLANANRRRLLVGLMERPLVDVSKLSGVPWEIDASDEKRLLKHHVHLPKLADAGYVEWDREANVATRGPRFDEVRPLLEALEEYRSELVAESA